jgi:succinylarginine dihydrolase
VTAREVNFDGLVGPTHNYAGLSYGNVASRTHAHNLSSPREAALQGLEKMKRLADLGLTQAVLPPHERPDVHTLRSLGFQGSDQQVIVRAAREAPQVYQACCSASAMWTANAATVSPSADTADGRVSITPANLADRFHRSLEPATTARVLRAIFRDEKHFAHHEPLLAARHFADEGAANHTRLCTDYGAHGLELFVFGRYAFDDSQPTPSLFPARQTFEASEAIARRHGLDRERVVFAQQNPRAIDAGVFHNDVIAVGDRNVLFCHEQAFLHRARVLEELESRFNGSLMVLEVSDEQVSLEQAVSSYLFNGQLLSLPNARTLMIVPDECAQDEAVSSYLQGLVDGNSPVDEVLYLGLRESMRNGGGPACLRLRVVLTPEESACTNPHVFFQDDLHVKLHAWVERHYRDRLAPEDLADPRLLTESRTALDELTNILGLGSVYPFQLQVT